MPPPDLSPLRHFVLAFGALLERESEEARVLDEGRRLLAELVADDAWLPDAFARPLPERYAQYLLHCDSLERFCVVSFVWGPGQQTPVHNHTVWGLIGMLRGAETSQPYAMLEGALRPHGPPHLLKPGDVEAVSPTVGDIHQVSNALADRASVSIHVYGANIGAVRRAVFDGQGRPKLFISGYANTVLPNPWDLSSSGRAQAEPAA
jgi:predicted metal-dependent enzyme (double-stranded beta helix superfamily)